MSKTEPQSVDEYIASQPETVRVVLDRVRSTIRKAVPRAVEGISYKIPTYKLDQAPLLYFASWKQHYSLYPVSEQLITSAAGAGAAASYEISKGTLRLPYSAPVPSKLIAQIAKLRAKEVAASEQAKPKAAKPRAK